MMNIELAEKVATYLALACNLNESDSRETYRMANKLAWELAILLPDEIYRSIGKAISEPDTSDNLLTVVIQVRKLLLGADAGNLTAGSVMHHAPEIAKKRG
jgi:hypothetical protein